MALEAAPDDQAAIDGILREAHTMKGAAGMVGMMRVSRLAHRLEDLLVELRSGTRRSTPELTDSMLLVVDGLARLIANPSSAEQDTSDELAMERLLPTPALVASLVPPPPTSPTSTDVAVPVSPSALSAPSPTNGKSILPVPVPGAQSAAPASKEVAIPPPTPDLPVPISVVPAAAAVLPIPPPALRATSPASGEVFCRP